MARRWAFGAALLGIGVWLFTSFDAGAEERGCPFGVPHPSGHCHAPLPREACQTLPPSCTPHPFKVGSVEYCQYKQFPCDGKPDAKKGEAKPDRFAVGIGKCDQAVAAGKRCKWDGINCYEQTAGRYGQETFEPVGIAQCRGESVQAFLDSCAFWIRRGHVTTNCPTRERLAQPPYDGAHRLADAIPPAPQRAAAPPQPPAPAQCPVALAEYAQVLAQRRDREIFKGSDHMKAADAAFEGMSRRISANAECRRLCGQDSACAPWLELVVQLIDEKEGTCVAVERMLAPSDAVLLLNSAEVLRRCKRHVERGPTPARAPTPPTVEAPSVGTPAVRAPAPTCASWHPSAQVDETANFDQRQGQGTCSIRNLTAQQCTAIGGSHFKPDHGSGFTECFRAVGPTGPVAAAPPRRRGPTPPTAAMPTAPRATSPTTPSPTVRGPSQPNAALSNMSARCRQLVTNYVTAARAKDGPRALAGYHALKAAGGCGVLHKVDRPQPRVRAPSPNDSRFIARGATPNTDRVVGACDASPAECAARVRQLQAGTSPEAKAALYSHAFSVGLQLGTMVGGSLLMAVPPAVPTPRVNTAGPGGVRNTYGQGAPLRPAPRTRQSDITGTK